MTDTPTTQHQHQHDHQPRGSRLRRRLDDDRGSATAEYAVVILATVVHLRHIFAVSVVAVRVRLMYHYRVTVSGRFETVEVQAAYYEEGDTFVEFFDDNQVPTFAYAKNLIVSIEKVNGN